MAGLTDPDLLVKAAKKHKADEFKSALALSISVEETVKTTLRRPLISIMKSYPSARGVERDMCTCKDFEKVATQVGSIFREALYTCHCDVGRNFSQCDNLHHIEALDFRAVTFVALGELEHAMKDAKWMLELAPQLPDVRNCALYEAGFPSLTSPDGRDT
ncbi:hypothetical protein E4U11_004398 [Claviceps purpurea]|nr:hypothetical protein E4U11_004398 [Claviceps purpurea]